MGNHLVGIAPSQIYPVEHYLTDHTNLRFDINLGSTRFFKVARAYSPEGLVVVKVFVIHDPTLPLNSYRVRIEEIRSKLSSAVNCLPFRKAILSDKAAYLMREYVKYSLYDRISTRPFLTLVEKKWIAFQILYALHQCHRVGVCHGDIKLENILVTSWHWVLLTDFASYKPAYLPDDNPADFSFFFDTSRRRTCYIAPERFITSNTCDTYQSLLLPTDENVRREELTPAMDIFSAGCVLAELFSDGRPPFDLSQLLAYRNAGYDYVPKFLQDIEDPVIRDLIQAMTQKDPSKRLSAELYLNQERGRLFPEYFYTFLQPYVLIFSSTSPIMSPDEKIERLRKDIENIINLFNGIQSHSGRTPTSDDEDDDDRGNKNVQPSSEDPLVLVTTLTLSCIRGLRMTSCKLQALEILTQLSKHTSVETILERILPYALYLLQDSCPRVRVSAVRTLNECLMAVSYVPSNDANVFPEYILPSLIPIVNDEAVVVRIALAETIAQIAETALRFLEYTQEITLESNELPAHGYEIELRALREMVQQCVSSLLTDLQNVVKRTLIENGIVKLCIFFGKYEANDIILSHMITFLNDKSDKQLRMSFFDCIGGVAGYIGVHCSPILTPLLQQGFTDTEEFVVRKAINAMSALTQLGLLHKTGLYELVKDTACFLIHPNLWIRQAIVGFISMLTYSLSTADIHCKVFPVVMPFLDHPLIQLNEQLLLLNSLKSPVPRIVYDSVVRYGDLELFLETLQERQHARTLVNSSRTPSTSCVRQQNTSFQNFFRRLSSEGMTEEVEDKLLMMADHLRKLNKSRASVDTNQSQPMGKIDISHLQHRIKYQNFHFSKDNTNFSNNRRRTAADETGATTTMNEDWKQMFGSEDVADRYNYFSSDNLHELEPKPKQMATVNSEMSFDAECLQEKSFVQYHYPPCRLELGKLMKMKQEQYKTALQAEECLENESWIPSLPPPGWELKSILVAHLNEHKSSVNKLVSVPDTVYFASCSSDSCIKLWDCAKMEGRNIVNKSQQTYNARCGPLNSMTICRGNQSLAAVSDTGSVFVTNVDPSSNKITVLDSRQLDLIEEGCAIDIAYFDPGSQVVLVYITMHGYIIGWDLRAYGNAWKIKTKSSQGVVSTMCMDPFQKCCIVGTGCGYHTCVDLRFRLPITSIVHPYKRRVRKIIRHPKESSWIISGVQGNNEVSVWNLETGFQQMCFWASDVPPLTKTVGNKYAVCSLYAYIAEHSPVLLTGGTDQRLRRWNLKPYADKCCVAIPAADDDTSVRQVAYQDKLIDGTRVVHEYSVPSQTDRFTEESRLLSEHSRLNSFPELPSTGHRDAITDITMCQTSQCFLVTSSRDGVIKVWK